MTGERVLRNGQMPRFVNTPTLSYPPATLGVGGLSTVVDALLLLVSIPSLKEEEPWLGEDRDEVQV